MTRKPDTEILELDYNIHNYKNPVSIKYIRTVSNSGESLIESILTEKVEVTIRFPESYHYDYWFDATDKDYKNTKKLVMKSGRTYDPEPRKNLDKDLIAIIKKELPDEIYQLIKPRKK